MRIPTAAFICVSTLPAIPPHPPLALPFSPLLRACVVSSCVRWRIFSFVLQFLHVWRASAYLEADGEGEKEKARRRTYLATRRCQLDRKGGSFSIGAGQSALREQLFVWIVSMDTRSSASSACPSFGRISGTWCRTAGNARGVLRRSRPSAAAASRSLSISPARPGRPLGCVRVRYASARCHAAAQQPLPMWKDTDNNDIASGRPTR